MLFFKYCCYFDSYMQRVFFRFCIFTFRYTFTNRRRMNNIIIKTHIYSDPIIIERSHISARICVYFFIIFCFKSIRVCRHFPVSALCCTYLLFYISLFFPLLFLLLILSHFVRIVGWYCCCHFVVVVLFTLYYVFYCGLIHSISFMSTIIDLTANKKKNTFLILLLLFLLSSLNHSSHFHVCCCDLFIYKQIFLLVTFRFGYIIVIIFHDYI